MFTPSTILVDFGSSAYITNLECLCKLKYTKKDVTSTRQPLIGFEEGFVYPMVDTPLPYNSIMGIPTMKKVKAGISYINCFCNMILTKLKSGKNIWRPADSPGMLYQQLQNRGTRGKEREEEEERRTRGRPYWPRGLYLRKFKVI